MRACIPEKIDGSGGKSICDKPVRPLAAASIPERWKARKRARESRSNDWKNFRSLSRGRLSWTWILALALPCSLPLSVRFDGDVVEAAQTKRTTAEKNLGEATESGGYRQNR